MLAPHPIAAWQHYARSTCSAVLTTLTGSLLLTACQPKQPQPEAVDPLTNRSPHLRLIPDNSLLLLTLATDPQDYRNLNPASLTSELTDDHLSSLPQLQEEAYVQEIAPWIGETVDIAILDPALTAAEETIPGMVVTTTTKDATRSTQFLADLRQHVSAEEAAIFEDRSRGDVILHVQTNGTPGSQWVTASFGQSYVALANDASLMDQVIATYQEQQPSILAQEEFRSLATDLIEEDTLFFAYLNFQACLSHPDVQAQIPATLDASSLAQLEAMQSLGWAGGWHPAGFRVQTQVNVVPEGIFKPTEVKAAASQLIPRLPGQTLALFSGFNVAQNYQDRLQYLQQDPQASAALTDFKAQLLADTGLDLDQDLLNWMDGEIVLSVQPETVPLMPFLPPLGLVAMIETSQPEQARLGLAKLDLLAEQKGLSVQQQQEQVVWQGPFFPQPLLVRQWDGETLILSSSPANLQLILEGSATPLPQTAPFQTVWETLPQSNYGYFLINSQEIRRLVQQQFPQAYTTLKPEVRQMVESLQALGITSYPLDQDSYRVEVLIHTAIAEE
ncbi:MAG: DUF3352 domain-containing protein [Synechococcaceae cyanobacterium SM2_3_1]|nr:DUF3352 domain-containing protein [Synechococcaceae cyanobacterium SM2_3_1]